MPKYSAGLLLYRKQGDTVEVFLVHPGGPYWEGKDLGAWSIPKGEYDPATEDALEAAKREFEEETGFVASTLRGELMALQTRKQPSGKMVSAWLVEGDCDALAAKSNTFAMQWPPNSGQWQRFPEVDRAEWFDLATARQKILKGQVGFIDELESNLGNNAA
ncbi:MAG: NUDIX domain-containing protein [Armatimonas sp.]